MASLHYQCLCPTIGRVICLAIGLSATVSMVSQAADDTDLPLDPDSGLVMAEGWETVKGHCTVCHSARLVTQNRGSRSHWSDTIKWMQETQGLWPFSPEMEDTILTYLTTHYGPSTEARRQPLPPRLMPPSPADSGEAETTDSPPS